MGMIQLGSPLIHLNCEPYFRMNLSSSPSPLRRLSLFQRLFVRDFQAVVCLMVGDLEAEKVGNRSDSDWLC